MATTTLARTGSTSGRAIEGTFARVAAIDFSRPLTFALLAVAYVLSRAPFLSIGYGTDPDAWRVALSGLWLWDHHEFYPSRLPGYPLPELASAAVIKGGPVATNGLTMLVSLLGLWFFAQIVKRLALPQPAIIVVAFAFTPLLWINSMTTMDYMWALTFILGAYYFLLSRQPLFVGVMVGLAVASRSTSLFMLIPVLAYMWRDGMKREIRTTLVAVIAISLAAWAPIYWKYDLTFLNFYDGKVGDLVVARLLAKDTLGIIGAIAVCIAALVSLPRLLRLPADVIYDKNVMFWVLAIAVALTVFARLPHEAAYLIPVYPFGYFLMAKYFRSWAFVAAAAAIVLAGVFDFTAPGEEIGLSELTQLRPGQGLLLSNRDTMKAQISYTEDLEALEIPPNTVVAVGFVYPMLAVRNYDDSNWDVGILREDRGAISQLTDAGKIEQRSQGSEGLITWVWLLQYEDFDKFRREAKSFVFTQDAGRSQAALYEYRMGLFGGQEIDLGRSPTGGSGAARTDR